MSVRLLIAAFLMIMSGPALAADPQGTWALRAGDTTIMLFKVTRSPRGWSGEWMEPAHYDSDGNSFSNVSGPVERKKATTARAVPGGGVELTFGHQPGTIPNVFVIRARGASTADLDFIAFGSEPATLTRATLGQRLGGWDRSRVYVRTIDRPTNAEMTAIFDADQADRQHWRKSTGKWSALPIRFGGRGRRRCLTQACSEAARIIITPPSSSSTAASQATISRPTPWR